MPYIDGFVLPVPKANVEIYQEISTRCGEIWKEHGALQYRECIAEDVKPGELTSFPQSVKLEGNETVIFAYIVYKSREHRDEVNGKVMSDQRMKEMMNGKQMPFDSRRMIYGGFEVLVDL
jgi:uncharacterized protein YbaA (DUF1428 family)